MQQTLTRLQKHLDQGTPCDPDDIQAVVDSAVYWEERCRRAEEFIKESPCDPDITDAQWEAYLNWEEFMEGDFEEVAQDRQWVSVEERLPEQDGAYLCADSALDIYVAYRFPSIYGPKAYFNGLIDDKPKHPTHWQSLPKPPEGE